MVRATALTKANPERLRVVLWGTYDLGKPRNRILIRALRDAGVDLLECHADAWAGVADKAGPGGWRRIAGGIGRSLLAYPALLWRYARQPQHDIALVGYLGHLDVLLLWPFARLRGVPIVWDAFLSLHETVVEDRAMVGRWNPIAWLLWLWDWLAARAARLVLLDTQAHADWFAATFHLRADRVAAVLVGAEPDVFAALPQPAVRAPDRPLRILFYGQFIALHGIETIVEAAARSDPARQRWTLIGTGQEAARIRRLLEARPIANLEWIEWVPYRTLRDRIEAADICLGIFGASGKAARVIPNKVFQVLAAGRPLVTRDSLALRELVPAGAPGIRLVPPGDAAALLAAIEALAASGERPSASLAERFSIAAIGRRAAELLQRVAAR
jgi:glycosyltransferase involved in cell wall biosynthesis